MMRHKNDSQLISRRTLLKSLRFAPLIFRSAPLYGSSFLFSPANLFADRNPAFPFSDARLTPHYPEESPLADVLRLAAPGSDEYVTEKYAFEIDAILKEWGKALKASVRDLSVLAKSLDPSFEASSLGSFKESQVRSGFGIDVVRRRFTAGLVPDREQFLHEIASWLYEDSRVETAEFEIYGIEELASSPLTVRLDIRYDIVATQSEERREERVGSWSMEWFRDSSNVWITRRLEAGEESLSVLHGPAFIDVTHQALGKQSPITSRCCAA